MDLPETDHYVMVITDDPEHAGTDCYGVKNRYTDVMEYYDNLLPRTYNYMHQMDEKYSEMMVLMSDEFDAIEGVDDEEVSH